MTFKLANLVQVRILVALFVTGLVGVQQILLASCDITQVPRKTVTDPDKDC